MDLLHAGGIGVDLATATASPPPWLTTAHPEILPVTASGETVWPGARQHWRPTSPVFRQYALHLVRKMAERYTGHPALVAWHISNELGCHNIYDYSDDAAAAFRDWLRARYTTLEALNHAWGTAFWSQRYSDWEQILPPRLTGSHPNPTQQLDFKRFSSDALKEYLRAERDVLREITPDVPITTNFMVMNGTKGMNYADWAPEIDFVSNDHYVHPGPQDRDELSFSANLTGGIAGGQPWFLMEHSTSAVNWQPVNVAKRPGDLARDSLLHVAHGADAVCYFQWRQSRQGAEKFHSGMVSHAGEEGRTYQEVKRLGAELAALGPEVIDSRIEADVAILHEWNAWWAGAQDGRLSSEVDYPQVVHAWHRALWEAHLTADFAHPEHDLSPYKLVVVPQLYLLTDAAIDNLLSYVRAGGTLVCGFLTGVADEDDRVRPGGMDARLRELFGIRTLHEWWPLDAGESVECDGFRGTLWSEELEAAGDAELVVPYKGGELDGLPALLRKGRAWYISTLPEPPALRDLLADVAAGAGVRPPLDGLPPQVEAVRRGELLFVFNHSRETVTVEIPGTHRDLLTGELVTDSVELARYGAAVLAP